MPGSEKKLVVFCLIDIDFRRSIFVDLVVDLEEICC